ncbi:nucleotide-diphospho-sugar transferase [Diplogelasinospora grovesii]|uniref:Nucleotide-diphospho-sugar transferase n=1 Tax=Diplogelasinospora grovesii TaxID=303347 RepID=A0AAN6S2R1_9PEZI|nr:nucleotide-diphospho-sugar transferase [Diplogelasinospora grovesii]
MRFRPLAAVITILALAFVVLIATRVAAFVKIFGAHSGQALTQEEVEIAYNRSTTDPAASPLRQEFVPKIIHQIFHNWKDPENETLPADWEATRQTCTSRNPGFEYRLWTERASLQFIATNYEWFLPTYEGYQYPVQRVDALRYFLMRHYGGIYIDLDNGCSRDLLPLLHYPAWVTDGGQGALSNNILGARPGHGYWIKMTDSLIPWGYKYPLPYLSISYASGQWFETAIWEEYHAQLPSEANEEDRLYRIMMDMRDGAARWVFFTQGRGGSWDNWDNHFFGWIGNRLVPEVGKHLASIVIGTVAFAGLVWFAARRGCFRSKKGYRKLPTTASNEEHEMV